jgi:hypothetical protein
MIDKCVQLFNEEAARNMKCGMKWGERRREPLYCIVSIRHSGIMSARYYNELTIHSTFVPPDGTHFFIAYAALGRW